MTSLFETRVAQLWDACMDKYRRDNAARWIEIDADTKTDMMMLATELCRDAFEEGVQWTYVHTGWSYLQMENAMHKMYPFPKVTKWRTVRYADGSCEWQVRDGITWYRSFTGDGQLRKHQPVENVIKACVDLGDFAGAALLAGLAANPTEE